MQRTFAQRVRRSLEGCRFRPSLRLDLFEDGYCADILGFLISLPFMDRWWRHPHEIMESWGVYYDVDGRSIVFCWGDYTKFVHMPWDWKHISHEVRRPDGTWVPYVGTYEKDKEPDGRWLGTYPYRYVLKSGEVQDRTATVYVDRHEWRWKCLKWLPWFAKKRVSIDVMFDDEVGERSGSWKGGTIGCGWDLRKGETPEQSLRRMEREREFR